MELHRQPKVDFQREGMISKLVTKILSLSIVNASVFYLWNLWHIAQLNKVKGNTLHNILKDIKDNHLDITSDFPKRDTKALESVTQMALKENMVVAEIGSWKGMSTSILAKTVKPFGGTIFAIDHWLGSIGVFEHKQVETDDMLSIFRYNMKALNIFDIVHPLVMTSKIATSIFKDNSLDMVFIDADHRYSHIKEDIEMWLPKLKQGGIIAGHDAEEKYTKFSEYTKVINQHLEEDVIVGVCHPGVTRALYDIFQDNYNIVPNSSIWWKRK